MKYETKFKPNSRSDQFQMIENVIHNPSFLSNAPNTSSWCCWSKFSRDDNFMNLINLI